MVKMGERVTVKTPGSIAESDTSEHDGIMLYGGTEYQGTVADVDGKDVQVILDYGTTRWFTADRVREAPLPVHPDDLRVLGALDRIEQTMHYLRENISVLMAEEIRPLSLSDLDAIERETAYIRRLVREQ